MAGEEQVYLSVVRQDILKYDMMVKSLVQEIRELDGSQADLDDIGSLVRSRIAQLREQIEELKRLAQEEDNEDERCQLAEEAARSEKMLQDDHRAFRNALLAAQLTINQRSKDELLSKQPAEGEGEGSVRQRRTRELLLRDSSRLSEDLLTVTRLIQDNVQKSAHTVDTLVEGSQSLTSTHEELKTMGSVISQARKILNKYGRRENTDKLLIFLGLVFFLASCLVVVRNRFIF
ncbi:vesicle transport protein SEC20-like isoform X2 [Eriocheir sinensis]|nr:vesicle transport protein SEC20-like isoform X2 [Eriocheir sinensis]XP_050695998.1 vesicle transport protein SEC20-like isoform X2 [Eriocheir sinensis]XP_050695999.1 vesicle transport protein SEC20-like isoform X2 [Eriocheir sinensis]XP_050696000.1 vesicle transport protein SEC20-like isoform X2 [Eriocheir sinensis]XP_050696002.1 vesicle transport protein SEC20-like isoform X2 [Eriocheir sinensis]XP_050696003.1 vesicle transport protein SEC20-like isoform X2 [Eriocheir sinensis]XP_05069600